MLFPPHNSTQRILIEKTLTIHITRQLIKRNPEKGKERTVQMLDFSSMQRVQQHIKFRIYQVRVEDH